MPTDLDNHLARARQALNDAANQHEASTGSCVGCKFSEYEDYFFDDTKDLKCSHPLVSPVGYDAIADKPFQKSPPCRRMREDGICGPVGALREYSLLHEVLYSPSPIMRFFSVFLIVTSTVIGSIVLFVMATLGEL